MAICCGGLGTQGGQTDGARGVHSDPGVQTEEGKGRLSTGGGAALLAVLVRRTSAGNRSRAVEDKQEHRCAPAP